MKQLTCEMCGGTDIAKQDGFFVCQSCGMKYSVEEAKKMMIEGTVDVQGTVKVDNSAFVEKCLANARRAMQKEDWEETEKYYNLVEQNDPSNLEAIFYSAYGKAKASLVDKDIYKRQAIFKVLQNCVSIIDDNFDISKTEENKEILEKISNDIFKIANSNYVYNYTKNLKGEITHSESGDTVILFNNLGKEFIASLKHIAKKYSDSEKENRIYYYELALKHAKFILKRDYSMQREIDVLQKLLIKIDSSLQTKYGEIPRLEKEIAQVQDEIAQVEENKAKEMHTRKSFFVYAAISFAVFFVFGGSTADSTGDSFGIIMGVVAGILTAAVFCIFGLYQHSKVKKISDELADLHEKLYKIKSKLKETKKQQ